MEVKKTIKKIAAIGAAAVLFTGLGLAGASAALNNLPQPFITEEGTFDAHIIVGDGEWNPDINMDAFVSDLAIGQDIAGAIAEASELPVSETETVGTELIEDIFYGSSFESEAHPFGQYEFAQLLREETLRLKGRTIDYEQEIEFGTGAFELTFTRNLNVDEGTAGTYLFADRNQQIYTYTLDLIEDEFTDAVGADGLLEGRTIVIQGTEYYISEAVADKIVLLSGAVESEQSEGTTQTYNVDGKNYNVEVLRVIEVGDNQFEVNMRINGETTGYLGQETYELEDGTVIGVKTLWRDALGTEAGVEFFIGADEIELSDTNEVKFNGETNDDYRIISNFDTENLLEILIVVTARQRAYLEEGENWVDPVFGNWELEFEELVKTTEEISFSAGAGELVFTNPRGIEITIPVIGDEDSNLTFFGDTILDSAEDDDGNAALYGNFLIQGASDIVAGEYDLDLDYTRILAFNTRGEARVFELRSVDCEVDQEYDLYDLTAGRLHEGIGFIDTFTSGGYTLELTCTNVSLSEARNEIIPANGNWQLRVTDFGPYNAEDGIETELGGFITAEYDDEAVSFSFKTDTKETLGGFTVISEDDDSDLETSMVNVTMIDQELRSDIEMGVDFTKSGEDFTYGALFIRDDDNEDVTVEYPEERVYAEVRMNHIGAVVDPVADVSYEVVQGAPTPQRPVILIGGPAVNELVNDLVPTTWAAEDYTENTAIIQYIEEAFGGHDALIIAGYSREDTEVAGKVIAGNFRDGQYADQLTGNLVTLNTAAGFEGVEFN